MLKNKSKRARPRGGFHAVLKVVAVGFLWLSPNLFAQIPDTIIVSPKLSTVPVNYDADDPAIWIHPANPALSLIIGTDKGTYPNGGLFIWNMDGTQQQRINISHPNSVDVRYELPLGNAKVDIAVVSMRDHRQIRIFKIDADNRTLSDVSTLDSTNVIYRLFKSPLGLALYKRPTDGAIFAFVSSVQKEFRNKIWQIRLQDDGTGRVKGTLIRAFGDNTGVVEGMVVDDELGYFYAAEKDSAIHKYYADPDKGDQRLAFFATADGITGRREGLALYNCSDRTGYLLVSIPIEKTIKVYRRQGDEGFPHRHTLLTTIRNMHLTAGDGVEATNRRTSADFSQGLLIWHHGQGRRFQLYAWEDVAQNFLSNCPEPAQSTHVNDDLFDATVREFELRPNYPNPFNAQSKIVYALPQASNVRLNIYNVTGQLIRQLVNEWQSPGYKEVSWDGKNNDGKTVGSGVYLIKFEAGAYRQTRKITLLK